MKRGDGGGGDREGPGTMGDDRRVKNQPIPGRGGNNQKPDAGDDAGPTSVRRHQGLSMEEETIANAGLKSEERETKSPRKLSASAS